MVKNEHVIELAELPNTPDRISIKRVFKRTPLEYRERLEAEIQKIIPDSKVYGVDSTGLKQSNGAWSDKNKRRKDFKKLHIIADLVNRAIVEEKLTEGRRHDWKEMIVEWLEKTKQFLREYHIRSIIEAMIWLFKCIVGSAVQEK